MQKIETERKFIILKPELEVLKSMKNFSESAITQIYLQDSEKTHRIRKREYLSGKIEYTENTKKRVSDMSCIESEREISEDEFFKLSRDIEAGAKPLLKIRRSFDFCEKTFELDYYPEWESSCIMEIELAAEDEKIEFPDFIKILADVTGNGEYSNHRMAHKFPKEICV